mmetsp:Transcript_22117/g.58579  ORF Transcript_22117/g.58579 Transcript_22117/m.58579 type:complete len:263 (+) Transcript_22117:886-1674(+)
MHAPNRYLLNRLWRSLHRACALSFSRCSTKVSCCSQHVRWFRIFRLLSFLVSCRKTWSGLMQWWWALARRFASSRSPSQSAGSETTSLALARGSEAIAYRSGTPSSPSGSSSAPTPVLATRSPCSRGTAKTKGSVAAGCPLLGSAARAHRSRKRRRSPTSCSKDPGNSPGLVLGEHAAFRRPVWRALIRRAIAITGSSSSEESLSPSPEPDSLPRETLLPFRVSSPAFPPLVGSRRLSPSRITTRRASISSLHASVPSRRFV